MPPRPKSRSAPSEPLIVSRRFVPTTIVIEVDADREPSETATVRAALVRRLSRVRVSVRSAPSPAAATRIPAADGDNTSEGAASSTWARRTPSVPLAPPHSSARTTAMVGTTFTAAIRIVTVAGSAVMPSAEAV